MKLSNSPQGDPGVRFPTTPIAVTPGDGRGRASQGQTDTLRRVPYKQSGCQRSLVASLDDREASGGRDVPCPCVPRTSPRGRASLTAGWVV